MSDIDKLQACLATIEAATVELATLRQAFNDVSAHVERLQDERIDVQIEHQEEVARLKAKLEDSHQVGLMQTTVVEGQEREIETLETQAAAMRAALEIVSLHGTDPDKCDEEPMFAAVHAALATDAGRGYLSPDDAKRMAAKAVLEERAELRRSLELTHAEEKRALVDHVIEACAVEASRQGDWRAANAIRAIDRSKLLEGAK